MPTKLPQDIVEQDYFATHRHEFYLLPRRWKKFSLSGTLNWKEVRFHKNTRSRVPRRPGVYSILLQPSVAKHPSCSYLMYIGKADNLWRRYGEYLTREQIPPGRPKIRRFLLLYKGYIRFCFAEFPSQSLTRCENALLSAFVPPLNSDLPATISAARRAF